MIDKCAGLGVLYYWHEVARCFRETASSYDVAWLHQPLIVGSNPFPKSLVTVHTSLREHYTAIRHLKYPPSLRMYYNMMARIQKYCVDKISRAGGRFTVDSKHLIGELQDMGVAKERIAYIHNGVDTVRFAPVTRKEKLRDKFNLPREHVVLLSVGRLERPKQPMILLETFLLMQGRLKDTTLVLVGQGGLTSRVEGFIRGNNLVNVRLLKFVDYESIHEIYACADAYIMASYSEGQPLTLLEAMASGLPPIVSDIPGLRELVEESGAGLVVRFGDVNNAAVRIADYLRDKQLLRNHGRQAREFILNGWDWHAVACRYLEEFGKL
jgi:glycosyltransferase involved in cell wall biosynthesis